MEKVQPEAHLTRTFKASMAKWSGLCEPFPDQRVPEVPEERSMPGEPGSKFHRRIGRMN